jgi:exopolysaccharide biosynthesis polyprenyl glycosylphosphotransferase
MRTQLVKRHVAPEMLALSVLELLLTFALALILLTPSLANFKLASVHFALLCSITVCFTAFVIGLYRPQIFERAERLLFSTVLSALLSFPAVWLVTKVLGLASYWPVGYDSFRPIKIVVIWSIGVLSIRLLFLVAARLNLLVHRVALVAPTESPSVLAAERAGRKGFLEIFVISPENATSQFLAKGGIRTLVISAGVAEAVSVKILRELKFRDIKVETEDEFWERHLRRVDIENFEIDLASHVKATQVSCSFVVFSRMFDLVVSSALLIVTLPLMLIVAAIIRIDSPGSILYRQERVGLNSLPFTLLKFRSMNADAEALGPRWAQQKDPRVTRVGMFMRRTRVDELPQLLNIFQGTMSFIGPRPERPHFVEQLSEIVPNYHERARVKPGLTGWAQVNYPYGASVEDARAKLSYDLYYVKNRTVLLDILILLSTIRVILLQEGSR